MDRAVAGELGTRAVAGPVAPTLEQVTANNARYKHFYDSDAKTSLKFSSVPAFNAWVAQLEGPAKEKYKNWHVVETEKGAVIVYKEVNGREGFQEDGDYIEAVNGIRYRKSHADQRKAYTTEFKTFKSTKENPYSQWRKGAMSSLSGSNVIAKIVGAVISNAGLKDSVGGVKGYAEITSKIYNYFKTPLVAMCKSEFKIPITLGVKHTKVDTSIAKIVKSWQFKVVLLASLAASNMETIVIGVARDGSIPRGQVRLVQRGAIRGILSEAAAQAAAAINALSGRYNIDLRSVAAEFRAEYGGIVPQRVHVERAAAPRHELGLQSPFALTGPEIGEGALVEYTGEPDIFAGAV
jgi:hypothetical protein